MKHIIIIGLLGILSLEAFANCTEQELLSAPSTKVIELSCPKRPQFKYIKLVIAKITNDYYCIDSMTSTRSLTSVEIYELYHPELTETPTQCQSYDHINQCQPQPQQRQQPQYSHQKTKYHRVKGMTSGESLDLVLQQLTNELDTCSIETISNGIRLQRQVPQQPQRY